MPTCAACKDIYNNRVPAQLPPCDNCMPVFYEENKEALKIFAIVKNQYIMGMGGPIDISHLAIWKAIEMYGVKKKRETFEKVLTLSSWMLNRIMEKKE